MTEPFLGELRLLPYNFAPSGWALCNGQTLSISQNSALFSLLGTTYGGDGQTTFRLPDLRGRVPISSGQGVGLSPYLLGEVGGAEQVTLVTNNLPAHNHQVHASLSATTKNPTNALPAVTGGGSSYGTTSDAQMNPAMIGPSGAAQPHENRPPFLTLNWCIALQGVFPSRN